MVSKTKPSEQRTISILLNNPDEIVESQGSINPTSTIRVTTTGITTTNIRLIVKQGQFGRTNVMTPDELGEAEVAKNDLTIKTTNIPTGGTWFVSSVYSTERTSLEKYPLENLDIIRDKILLTPGDTVFDISNETMSVKPFTNFAKRNPQTVLNTAFAQYGLCLKTHNSDVYQNWINTEWIEGAAGINEASAVDVKDGKLSMDALNLAQKVYNFLNRIAISGGLLS